MPIFDFKCSACNKTFEALVMGSRSIQCPHCNSFDHEKLVSAPASPGKTGEIIKQARTQAAREGHFSNYSRSELRRKF